MNLFSYRDGMERVAQRDAREAEMDNLFAERQYRTERDAVEDARAERQWAAQQEQRALQNKIANEQLAMQREQARRAGEAHAATLTAAEQQREIEEMTRFAGAGEYAFDLYQTDPERGMVAWSNALQLLDEETRANFESVSLEQWPGVRGVVHGGLDAFEATAPKVDDPIAALRARAEAAGLQPDTPEYQEFMLSGGKEAKPGSSFQLPDGTRIDIDGGAGGPQSPTPGLSKLPAGYTYLTDENGELARTPDGRPIAVEVPGGPQAQEAQQAKEASARKAEQQQLKLGTTLTSLALNIAEIEDGGFPVTGAVGDLRRTLTGRLVTGNNAFAFGKRTDQINDAAAFAEIQNMRDNSPTGGAVGQLTDKEREAIGNAITALNSGTDAGEYLRAAKAYRKLALDLAYGEGKWELSKDGQSVTFPGEGSSEPTPDDLDDDELRWLSRG